MWHLQATLMMQTFDTHPTPTAEVSAQHHHQRQRPQQQQHVKQSKSTRTHHYNQAAANTAINTSPRVCACIHGTRNDDTLSGEQTQTYCFPLPFPFLSYAHPTRHTHHTRSSRKTRVPKVQASKHIHQATQGGNRWHLPPTMMQTFEAPIPHQRRRFRRNNTTNDNNNNT